MTRMKSHKISRAVSKKPRREGTRRTTTMGRSSCVSGDDDDDNLAEVDTFFDYDPTQLRVELLQKGVQGNKKKLSTQ